MDSTGYNAKSAAYFNYGRREMLPFIPEGAKRILEVGCGEGEFSANLKTERSVHVTGIEPFGAAARVASSRLDRPLEVDVNAGILELQGQQFDCIVCNDVLEHLVDPWDTLRRLRPLIAPGGALVASLPNMRFMPVLKDFVLKGEWRYVVRVPTNVTSKSPSNFDCCGTEYLSLTDSRAARPICCRSRGSRKAERHLIQSWLDLAKKPFTP